MVIEHELANRLRELVTLPSALQSPCGIALAFQGGSTCSLDGIGGRTEFVRGHVCDGPRLASSVRGMPCCPTQVSGRAHGMAARRPSLHHRDLTTHPGADVLDRRPWSRILTLNRPELMAGLAEDFDMNRWVDVARLDSLEDLARVLPLTPDLAIALVDDRRGRIREAVAENVSLPPDLVARLAVDPDPSVRLAVSMRPDLTEEGRATIDYEVRPEDRLSAPRWVLRSLDDLTVMSRCARSAHTGLRRFAACSPHLTPDLVNALAEDPDFAVRLLLCENHPDAPADLLLRTYLEAQVITRSDLLAKPNFPRSGLARDAPSADPKRRHLALLDPATTPEQVERLSHDEEQYVRSAAASDRRLCLTRAQQLLADPATAESAARNPLLPVRLMHEILDGAGVPPQMSE